jgi:predicted enzyme related to lactoylglutathione lyase
LSADYNQSRQTSANIVSVAGHRHQQDCEAGIFGIFWAYRIASAEKDFAMLSQSRVMTMIPVVNLEQARHFYGTVLGLREDAMLNTPQALGFHAGGGTMLALYQRGTPTKADHTIASWMVDDIEAVVQSLTANGVRFEQYDFPGLKTNAMGIADLGSERAAWFTDPEGNILAVSQVG